MTKHTPANTAALIVAMVLGLNTWALAQQPAATKAGPDLSIGAAQFPDTDAVILRREQSWTLDPDGAVRRRDHQWVKLLDSRASGPFADPRIDYCTGQDELTIRKAQTILPNGKMLPVPDYSFNKAGPDDVAGWPNYAGWTQTVICFSGVENGCVLELDYEIVTKPGVVRWVDADLRLNEDYPTVERVVSVTLPEKTALQFKVDGLTPAPPPEKESGTKAVTYRWTFKNLAAAMGEPQSPPWQKRCGRLRFTTCPNAEAWASTFLKLAEDAAEPGEAVKKFAEAAVEKETDVYERIRKVAKKVADSFNVVASPKTLRPMRCRPAAEVLRSNYGNPIEAAALLAAALRSLDVPASVEVAADATTWDSAVPTESAFAGMTVLADLPGGQVRIHPQLGIFRVPGHWGRHWLFGFDDAGKLRQTYVDARGEKESSEIQVTGRLTLGADGKMTGDLRLQLTGAFYDPRNLETKAQQDAFVKGIVSRILSDADVPECSIATLSDDALKATVKVASKGELKTIGKQRLLPLGAGPAFLPEFPLPLGRSYRKTDVYIGGRFQETIDLTIECPKDWSAAIMPISLPRVAESWGSAEQTVEKKGDEKTGDALLLHRSIAVTTDTVGVKDFESLRQAVNRLKTDAANLLAAGPTTKPGEQARSE